MRKLVVAVEVTMASTFTVFNLALSIQDALSKYHLLRLEKLNTV